MVADADVELITRMLRNWNSGDVDALVELIDGDVEVRPALRTFLASMVYRGVDGVRTWFEETNEPWAELQAEPERFLDAGDRTVVVIALHARCRAGRSPERGPRNRANKPLRHSARLRLSATSANWSPTRLHVLAGIINMLAGIIANRRGFGSPARADNLRPWAGSALLDPTPRTMET